MRSGLLSSLVLAAALFGAPAMALQSVTLPSAPGDNATNAQDPNNPAQGLFSSGQTDSKDNPFGLFHFNVTSGPDWPGDSYRYYHPQSSTPDAYGNAATPGSEFSTSNTLFPH